MTGMVRPCLENGWIRRPRTRWVDVIAQDIKNIEEESFFDDSYVREKWRVVVMAAMTLNGPIC
ncbi:Uncharacterized protein FWK35_00009727 [Aphis craccivora]|uniref:Uncharacterized protein n=1 Tax=Aphis craccivora TaxID=307492 RepID=A0A6G0ZPY5_APHCR|nr:Uncharacterized protein FWK35_00009727 [Aphis craccivora]